MKRITLTALFLLIGITTMAQKLIADETELVQLKSSVKVVTSNEAIFSLLLKEFKDLPTKYSVATKTDRKGAYIEYTVPFKNEHLPRIVKFFKELNDKAR